MMRDSSWLVGDAWKMSVRWFEMKRIGMRAGDKGYKEVWGTRRRYLRDWGEDVGRGRWWDREFREGVTIVNDWWEGILEERGLEA